MFEYEDLPQENLPFWKKKRNLIVVLAFFGFFNVYALRVNLSVAIVAMTDNRTTVLSNGSTVYESDFDWTTQQKGLVLSSFFYGYICTQFVGGYLGYHFGGNKIFAIGIGTTALLTLLTPVAANYSIYMLLAIRIIEGIFEGMTFPCMYDVWSKWAPPLERTRMAGFALAGNYMGTVVAMPLSGILAVTLGWESIFYVFGCVGLLWFLLWIFIVKRSPQDDLHMTNEERTYIVASLGHQKPNQPKFSEAPWKEIWTSSAVWAIIVAHFCESWGFFTLLTQLPSFLKDILNYDISNSGFLSALPYLTLSILVFVSSFLADWFQVKSILTTSQVRRYFNCLSFLGQTVFMLLAAFIVHRTYSVVLLTIGVGIGAFSLSGFTVNHLDIAPNYASILMGISNTFGTVPGIVSPLISGYIVHTPNESEWKIIFYITAGVYLFGSVFYWFFASGELQSWAVRKEDSDKKDSKN
ncbi:sialin-like isoform X2 [Bradysia coprophila]|uniref:sialin-like isoform X2 n=1 Tax=Bradysia coprophila TaxID=38358 RepID=UPI00187D7129|nr:sialin-like isoform X2 [Bradysia coprophila]